ncbi:MAG: histone deacetylase [Candidatus Cloacimonetes bacterium]|jgi:acetoin utilization deacetylase AcuC-like enzyme|nr:histone deacetylase [Candidatus Cloacimonadota bacterium]
MHPACGRHDTGWGHREHQGRLPAIVRAIEQDTPMLLEHVVHVEPDPIEVEALLRVHTARHVDTVRACAAEAARTGELQHLDSDTVVSAASWDAALAAAGCAWEAARMLYDGDADGAFALARPPGHHATPDRAMGFCLFNNVAAAARAVQHHGAGRVLIVDFDVHHGNGTQDIFYEDPSVYFLSLHQFPWYPGTGAAEERGAGAGRNTTRNVLLAAGTDPATHLRALEDALAAALEEFTPEMFLVSAGYDCMARDPLGGLLLEPRDIHALVSIIVDAAASARCRTMCVLEGGYDPARTGEGVVQTLRALAGLPPA